MPADNSTSWTIDRNCHCFLQRPPTCRRLSPPSTRPRSPQSHILSLLHIPSPVLFCTMSLPLDYYALLDIQRDASDLQIKQAYRRLALQWHPLKNKTGAPEQVDAQFTRISEAYDVLTDRQTHKYQ